MPHASEGSVWLAKLENDKLEFNTAEFENLMKKVGDREIATISICRLIRTGKSYLLNSFIKYHTFKGEEGFLKRKLDKQFVFRNTTESVTKGIRVWPEPFFITDENGKEFAVILLDTQGNSDQTSDASEESKLFALNALLSSTIIYNFMKQVHENEFQFLENFIQFSNLANEKASELVFLIRDFASQDFRLGKHDQSLPIIEKENFFKIHILIINAAWMQRRKPL